MLTKKNLALIGITNSKEVSLNPEMANRHGLITGATGTGKTISLQVLAETFSQMGVAVFAADAKGDLSGIAISGGNKKSVTKRVEEYALQDKGFSYQGFPVQFWDVFGELGTPVRTTIAAMGPLLLSRLLSLNETQTSILTIAFTIAKDENLHLVNVKDLRKLLEHIADNANQYTNRYGNIASTSIGAIQRNLITLEHDGNFFGQPSLSIEDLIQAKEGKGIINILASEKLMQTPMAYTSFLLWLMDELFATLPEVGDQEKPKLVFFFDEAHLLFNTLPKVLLEKVEQVIRLIRSKGVGIYFITQNPADIPDSILGQLGNRIQHALHAYTPKDRSALKAAAMSFRPNPSFDTENTISELETGEALVSFLDTKGAPTPVERVFIIPPQSSIGQIDSIQRRSLIESSSMQEKYTKNIETNSAYEALTKRENTQETDKEKAIREKEEIKQQKEREKLQREEQKRQEREATQSKKFWTGIAKSILIPFVRKALQMFLKR